MSLNFRMTLRKKDYDKTYRKFLALGERAIRRGTREALRAAAKPGVKNMRTRIPTESKALRKSIGVRVKVYPSKKIAYAIVGPRRGQSTFYDGRRRVPVFYAHLINNGFFHARSGRSIPGLKFVEGALSSSEGEMRRIYKREIGSRILKHAKRLK